MVHVTSQCVEVEKGRQWFHEYLVMKLHCMRPRVENVLETELDIEVVCGERVIIA